jgi:soluble lytic murein transglycosylase
MIGIPGILAAAPVNAESLREKANSIRQAMDARDFDRAESLVRELKSTDPAAFTANNYDYLLGRLAERRGLQTEATALYLSLLARNSSLSQYAIWHLARIARASGDLALERQYLSRLIASASTASLQQEGRERLVQNYLESGSYQAAISMLRPVASASGAGGRREPGIYGRRAMALLGEAYMKAGDKDAARKVFGSLIQGSQDDYALEGALGLDGLDRQAEVRPDEFEALRRARIYLQNRHWPEARRHLLDIIDRFPQSPNRPEALYQTGFAYYREDNYDDAITWFERAHSEFPAKKEGEQGYYWVATALQKARHYDEAARRYSDFIDAYAASDFYGRAFLNVVDCYRYLGKDAEALDWSGRIDQKFAGQPLGSVGIFDRAKIEMARGNYRAALAALTRLQAYPVSARQLGAPGAGEVQFLRACALEQMGRLEEAVNAYLAIPDERDNYFGRRATLRILALEATDQGRGAVEPLARSARDQARRALGAGNYRLAKDSAEQALRLTTDGDARRGLLEVLRTAYGHLPGYSSVFRFKLIPISAPAVEAGSESGESSHGVLAARLISLGLYDEGAVELRLAGLRAAASGFSGGSGTSGSADSTETERGQAGSLSYIRQEEPAGGSGDVAYSMAVYSSRGNQAHYAIAFAEPLFKSIPRDFELKLLPRDLAELIYPAPYRDALDHYCSALGVDPRIVLSLARQESRFNAAAKSPASARGLLQLIPDTAEKLANEEGIQGFRLDDVYNPEVAVRLAARYVSDLNKLFAGDPYRVAASYDAGEQSVERWIFRSGSKDTDRFVAEIAIPETKDYVAKVLSNYWAYTDLYTRGLKPAF